MKSNDPRSLSRLIAESEEVIVAARQAVEASRRLFDDASGERDRLIAAIEAGLSEAERIELERLALEQLRQLLPGWERDITGLQAGSPGLAPSPSPVPGPALAGPASTPPGQGARPPRRSGRARNAV